MTPVGANRQIDADLQCSRRSVRTDAGHSVIFLKQVGDLSLHLRMKPGIASCLLGDEVEKVPLRHESEKFAMRGQVTEIRKRDGFAADLARKLANFLMGPFEEL